MRKEVIIMPNTAESPFSSAVRAGGYIFVSGSVGHIDSEGKEVKGIETQTRQCLESMKQVLEAAGSSLSNVVKVTVFLAKADDWSKMNEVYKNYFPVDRPARTAVIASLINPEMLIEIECIAIQAS